MKTGDRVIVPAEINGYGRDLRAIVTEIEEFFGGDIRNGNIHRAMPGSLWKNRRCLPRFPANSRVIYFDIIAIKCNNIHYKLQ